MRKYLFLFIIVQLLIFETKAQFKEGYYYDKDNTKIIGLLDFRYGGSILTNKSDGDCFVMFRATEDSKKLKLKPTDITSFVIGTDSFTTLKNFSINAYVTYPMDFVKVLDTGRINLYAYYAIKPESNYSSLVIIWLVEKNGEVEYLNRGRFKNMFIDDYINDCPELVEKIKNKELKYKDIKKIVDEYNNQN